MLAIAAGGGVFAAAYFAADWGTGWSIFAGLVGFGVFQGVAGYLVQKRVKREMDKVQDILLGGQKQLQQKMQRWQIRPPGSIQAAQREIAEDTKVFVKKALERKVAVVPGTAFNCDTEASSDSFRLNYSTPSDEDIVKGIGILSDLAREMFC